MPITEAFATRTSVLKVGKYCVGPPKQGHLEKKRKKVAVDFVTVLKAGLGYNPYRAKSGLFAAAGASEGFQPKDQMRITNLAKEGAKMGARATQMAKSITDLRKAYRRANAAEAAGHADVAKIFRTRAKEINKAKTVSGGGGTAAAHSPVAQQAASHVHGTSDKGLGQTVVPQQLPASWQALVTHAKGNANTQAQTSPKYKEIMEQAKTMEGGPGKSVGVVPKTMEGGPGKSTGVVPQNVKYQPTYDKEGYISGKSAPDAKDAMRIENIMKQSGMDQDKMAKAATQMAKSITNAHKAYRRGMAATNENVHRVAKIFYDRADELSAK